MNIADSLLHLNDADTIRYRDFNDADRALITTNTSSRANHCSPCLTSGIAFTISAAGLVLSLAVGTVSPSWKSTSEIHLLHTMATLVRYSIVHGTPSLLPVTLKVDQIFLC